jgi:hypothetical protein
MPYLTGAGLRVETTGTGTSGTAFVQPAPHRAGDIVIIVLEHRTEAQAGAVNVAGYTKKVDHANGANSMQIWWRRALVDDEAAPVITHNFSDLAAWYPLTVTGAAAEGDPFNAFAVASQAAGTTMTCPTVTSTVADTGILTVVTTGANPTFTDWTNTTTSPRMVASAITVFGGLQINAAWGHKATAGATGTTTVTVSASVTATVATLAVAPGTVDLVEPATFHDSTLTVEPASAGTVALPDSQTGDLIVAVVSGTEAAKTFATTLTGFTKLRDVPSHTTWGRPFSIHTLRSAGSPSNPTITHTFGGLDDWTVAIFTVTGYLAVWQRDTAPTNTTHTPILHVETAAAVKVVALATSAIQETFTSCTFDVATGETEQEDGGAPTAKLALYTADAEEGWLGGPTWVLSGTAPLQWLSMGFAETAPADMAGGDESAGTRAVRRNPNI